MTRTASSERCSTFEGVTVLLLINAIGEGAIVRAVMLGAQLLVFGYLVASLVAVYRE